MTIDDEQFRRCRWLLGVHDDCKDENADFAIREAMKRLTRDYNIVVYARQVLGIKNGD